MYWLILHTWTALKYYNDISLIALICLLIIFGLQIQLLLVQNFSEHKNFEMFIDVCANLSKKFDYLHFIAVGDSISRKNYEEIVDKRNLGKKITFLGYVKEIDKIISNLDMFLLTSIWEGMPNVIMESMASKVPVVSTDIDGVRELIDDGENGFLVKSNDVNGMVSIISNILNNHYDIDLVISNAFEKISKNFSIDKMVLEYQDTFLAFNNQR